MILTWIQNQHEVLPFSFTEPEPEPEPEPHVVTRTLLLITAVLIRSTHSSEEPIKGHPLCLVLQLPSQLLRVFIECDCNFFLSVRQAVPPDSYLMEVQSIVLVSLHS